MLFLVARNVSAAKGIASAVGELISAVASWIAYLPETWAVKRDARLGSQGIVENSERLTQFWAADADLEKRLPSLAVEKRLMLAGELVGFNLTRRARKLLESSRGQGGDPKMLETATTSGG
ncbi:hypothetical protein [Amycolatopsis sp. NPDC051128]|uniref:hypothetical protein n=1 Tax=Amycolatopsis sp. NPDC051128 TaxID=3155412 RepID=UPI00341F666B